MFRCIEDVCLKLLVLMKTSNNHQKTFKKQQKCLNIIDNICRQGTWAKGTGTGEGNWTHGTGRRRLGKGTGAGGTGGRELELGKRKWRQG